ncbi:hypothetical protein [Actinokineospora sp. HUAS TT18]|uniref:hypothetical protein n=1 Tax=Actinokineospora sp. HUAS TT18 TaxID=3447451 RepID=UPI003F51B753
MTTETANASADELRDEIAALRATHEQFRADVRGEVLRQHFNGTWCYAGSQAVLTDLGLPPIKQTFTGVTTVEVAILGVDGADDLDEARTRVIAALAATCSDPGITFEVNAVYPSLDVTYVRED